MSRLADLLRAMTVLLACVVVPNVAHSQGTPINTNQYALDLERGPVIGPGRAIGLGGAYTSLVDGIDGVLWNAASYATRSRNSASFVRVDPTLSYGRVTSSDFNNSGVTRQPYSSFNIGMAGLALQIGDFGIGDLLEYYSYIVGPPSQELNVSLLQNHVGIGWMFFQGQLVVGAGYRLTVLSMQPASGGLGAAPYTTYIGHSGEAGVVYRPAGARVRLGAAFRSESDATHPGVPVVNGLQRIGNCGTTGMSTPCFVLPDHVVTPWEVGLGVAVQVGPRPFNVRWENPLGDAAIQRAEQEQEAYDQETRREETEIRQEEQQIQHREQQLEPQPSAPSQPTQPTEIVQTDPNASQPPTDDETSEAPSDQPSSPPEPQQLGQPEASPTMVTAQSLLPTPGRRRGRRSAADRQHARDLQRLQRSEARLHARLDRRERYAQRPRGYWLVTFDLQIIGPVTNGQGVDAFVTQTQHASGQSVTLIPHLGMEAEIIPNWLKLRTGTYLESSRYADVGPRAHITGAFDLKLFTTNLWEFIEPTGVQISATIDGADRYLNFGASLGIWE